MQIQVKLMGMLKSQTPPGGLLELADGTSIGDVLQILEISRDSVQLFIVNGRIVREQRHVLTDGDEFSATPPIGGG